MPVDAQERVPFLEARLHTLSETLRSFAEAEADYDKTVQVVAE